jgi:hypothetical protein
MLPSKPFLRIVLFSLFMAACASATNAAMDILSSRYEKSIFSYWPDERGWLDPQLSWKNKWKHGDPNQGPAFPLSTTTLVGVTDGWHFFKTCTIMFVLLALLAPFTQLIKLSKVAWAGVFCILYLLHGVVFESCFTFFFLK